MKKNFFWIDLEMTGLDENIDSILEVAVVITDQDFKPLEEYEQVVYQAPSVLENMNDFCKNLHGSNGLSAKVPHGKPLPEVEDQLLRLLEKHFSKEEPVVLCGNSVGNDRKFIRKYMTRFEGRLHYRLIDVSSFKEVFREKYNIDFKKKKAHRALEDIHESIEELKHYLSFVEIDVKSKK